MNLRVVPGDMALAPEYAERWRRIVEQSPNLASPYFSPEFTAAVAAVRENVFVGVLENDAGEICGFFPFERSAFSIGKPVGDILSDYQAVIATPETPWNPLDVLRGCGLAVWDFDQVIASQPQFARFHQVKTRSPCIDLAKGYEAYVAERRSSEVVKTIERMRKCARQRGDLRFDPDVRDPALMSLIAKWKAVQYDRMGVQDKFAITWIRELLDRIFAMKSAAFAGILSVLWAGDKPIAAHFGMRSRSVWHGWFTAYDPEVAKYSPGLILFLKMAEVAPCMGLRTIDLGKGETRWKQGLMNSAVEVAAGSVGRVSPVTCFRCLRHCASSLIRKIPLDLLRPRGTNHR